MVFQTKQPSREFFMKSWMNEGYEFFQNVGPALQNHTAKNICLGAKLISNL